MLLFNLFFTDHSIEQYAKRTNNEFKSKQQIIRLMKKDLRTMNIRRIIRNGKQVNIFTGGYKEFICIQKKNGVQIITFIKRDNNDHYEKISKLERQKCSAK
jgi:bifunctional pyridoxal-dependent enzyme with beta-cystathionase and maltose regulon repressor activities